MPLMTEVFKIVEDGDPTLPPEEKTKPGLDRLTDVVSQAFKKLSPEDQRKVRQAYTDEYSQDADLPNPPPMDPDGLADALLKAWTKDLGPAQLPQTVPAAQDMLDRYLG